MDQTHRPCPRDPSSTNGRGHQSSPLSHWERVAEFFVLRSRVRSKTHEVLHPASSKPAQGERWPPHAEPEEARQVEGPRNQGVTGGAARLTLTLFLGELRFGSSSSLQGEAVPRGHSGF
jgi:hypothetical protein